MENVMEEEDFEVCVLCGKQARREEAMKLWQVAVYDMREADRSGDEIGPVCPDHYGHIRIAAGDGALELYK